MRLFRARPKGARAGVEGASPPRLRFRGGFPTENIAGRARARRASPESRARGGRPPAAAGSLSCRPAASPFTGHEQAEEDPSPSAPGRALAAWGLEPDGMPKRSASGIPRNLTDPSNKTPRLRVSTDQKDEPTVPESQSDSRERVLAIARQALRQESGGGPGVIDLLARAIATGEGRRATVEAASRELFGDRRPLDLVLFDTDRIAEYVFESSRPPVIAGASTLLREINAEVRRRYPDEVLFSGGGEGLLLARAGRGAEIEREIVGLYTATTGGALTATVGVLAVADHHFVADGGEETAAGGVRVVSGTQAVLARLRDAVRGVKDGRPPDWTSVPGIRERCVSCRDRAGDRRWPVSLPRGGAGAALRPLQHALDDRQAGDQRHLVRRGHCDLPGADRRSGPGLARQDELSGLPLHRRQRDGPALRQAALAGRVALFAWGSSVSARAARRALSSSRPRPVRTDVATGASNATLDPASRSATSSSTRSSHRAPPGRPW